MTDAKIATLYENHRQYGSIKYLSEKVEGLRSKATMWGVGTSLALLFGNEVSRFTLRSPVFKLKPVALLFVLVAPTAYFKYIASTEAEGEVQKYWRIHKVREEKGLGGSYKESGHYSYMTHNARFLSENPISINLHELILGKKLQTLPDNDSIKLIDSWDDTHIETLSVESDRVKKFKPKDGIKTTTWFMKPLEDTDQKFKEGGIDNDHLYHEPPDPRMGPVVDQKMDEKRMFNFNIDAFGNDVSTNKWLDDWSTAIIDHGAPWWGPKLYAIGVIDDATRKEFQAQYYMRREFNTLKFKHLQNYQLNMDLGAKRQTNEEINNFINKAREDRGKNSKITQYSRERFGRNFRD